MSDAAVSEPAHVALSGVVRQYEGPPAVHALGPIDLTIPRGEFFSVVGPSGCGKSTLLDVLCGLARPTSGSVKFEGSELHGEVPDGIGVVFQEDASMPWLSVRQNVAFGLRTSGLPNTLQQEVEDLEAGGTKVVLKVVGLLPGVTFVDSIMDPKWIEPCLKNGHERGLADAAEMAAFWGTS